MMKNCLAQAREKEEKLIKQDDQSFPHFRPLEAILLFLQPINFRNISDVALRIKEENLFIFI